MLLKLLPGLAIGLALGYFFCLPQGRDTGTWSGAKPKWSVDNAKCDAVFDTLETVRNATSRFEQQSGDGRLSRTGNSGVHSSIFLSSATKPPTPVSPPAMSDGRRFRQNGEGSTGADHSVDAFSDATQVAEVASATAHRVYDKQYARAGNSNASKPVYGSQSAPGSTSAFANVFCDKETSAWIPTSEYSELPVKGIEVWASAMHYKSDQKERRYGRNTYSHDGNVYSVGLRQDWSVDSVIGFSFDILDADVSGRYYWDKRENEVKGYLGNAHYQGTFLGKYPVELKGTYGRLYHEGKGSFERMAGAIEETWKENRHRSHYYAFSAKAGLPLLFAGTVKVLPELGIDWRQIKTSEYKVTVGASSTPTHVIDSMKSRSLLVPATVTAKRELKQCWGLVTPRATLGYAREFEKSATGVRALNSSSASRPPYYPGQPVKVSFEDSQKGFWMFGAGLDIRSVGGWDVSAEYNRNWAKEYSRDEFKVELGRCF